MALKVGIKRKVLSVASEFHIIKKVVTQPYVTRTKLAKELGLLVLTANNITTNENYQNVVLLIFYMGYNSNTNS
jgi:hypothetical protein